MNADVEIIDFSKLEEKDIIHKDSIKLKKGLNLLNVDYINSVILEDVRISLRLRVSNKDILRSYPSAKFGSNINQFVHLDEDSECEYRLTLSRVHDFTENSVKFGFKPFIKSKLFRHFNDEIDQCYVINLKNRKDKRDHIDRQLGYHSINFSFFEAVNGSDEQTYKSWFNYASKTNRKVSPNEKKIGRPEIYYSGAWGYNETWISIIKDAKERNLQSIAIFDDDVILSKNFNFEFNELVNSNEYDESSLIYLGCRFMDKHKLPELDYLKKADVVGSYAVILKSDVFDIILRNLEERIFVVDGFPLTQIQDLNKSLFIKKPLVIPIYQNGDIRHSRDSLSMYKDQLVDIQDYNIDVSSRHEYKYSLIYNCTNHTSSKRNIVIGVKTKNRINYFSEFIDSLVDTYDSSNRISLIVADTSDDKSIVRDYLQKLNPENMSIHLLELDDGSVTDLSNAILSEITNYHLTYNPFIFMADDDVLFLKKGWENLYCEAMLKTPYKHLVFYDELWRVPQSKKSIKSNGFPLETKCSWKSAQGAFYCLTSDLLARIGIYNKEVFPTKGGGHLNYTYRLYNELGLNFDQIFDVCNSNKYIKLQPNKNYIGTGSDLTYYHQIRLNNISCLNNFEDRIKNTEKYFQLSKRLDSDRFGF